MTSIKLSGFTSPFRMPFFQFFMTYCPKTWFGDLHRNRAGPKMAPHNRPSSTKKRRAHTRHWPFLLVLGPTSPESIPIEICIICCWYNFNRFGFTLLQCCQIRWWICCCFGAPFVDNCLQTFCFKFATEKKQVSDEIWQDQTRSNTINQRNARHTQPSATCRNESRNATHKNCYIARIIKGKLVFTSLII